MNRDEKKQQAERLHGELLKARGVFLSGFEGITVEQDSHLRAKMAETGAKYKVIKNSLIERASKGTALEPAAAKLKGTTAVALTESDPVVLAKALIAYAKERPVFVFKTGFVEGRVVSMEDLNAIAALPPKEGLFAKVLFLINSPAQRVATVSAQVARNLAVVLGEAVKEKKFKE
jgi:large subunit ribosomal protein L10